MKTIIALGASNSKVSINKALATYAANQISNAEVIPLDLNDFEMPMYGIDLEKEEGIPKKAKELDAILAAADGIVLSLAEHNGSYAAVFKNTLDWLSRIEKELFKNMPMLLMAAAPGPRGATTILDIAAMTLPYLGANIVATFSLPSYEANFTTQGLKDEGLNNDLNQKISLLNTSLI